MTKDEALKRLDAIRGNNRVASLDSENWIFESGLQEEKWSVYLSRFVGTKGSMFFNGKSMEEVIEAAEKYVQENC